MNYYERHLGDYAKDTAHLTMIEHGAYTLLLDRYYSTEAGIPADKAHRVARARSKEEKAAVDVVLGEFFTLTDGIWTKGRVSEEINKAQTRIKAAKENGLKGGRPKKGVEITRIEPTGLLAGYENGTQEKALHTPDTSNQEPVLKTLRPVVAQIFPQIQDRQLVDDWVRVRKAKKAVITQTALDGFMKEVEKSGLSLEDVLRSCCEHNWAGFKASWVQKQETKTLDEITPELFDWAVEQGIPESRVKPLTDKFILNHRSKGHEFTDWEAAWKLWMINSVGYAEQRR